MAKILVVDDEKMVRDVLAEMLRRMGHGVRTAFNGFEALRLFGEKPFDLVTTDLNMPVMDGYILAKRIKQTSPDTPVIMVTGCTVAVESRITKSEHVDFVLSKPFTFKTLEKAIARFLHSVSLKKKTAVRHDDTRNSVLDYDRLGDNLAHLNCASFSDNQMKIKVKSFP